MRLPFIYILLLLIAGLRAGVFAQEPEAAPPQTVPPVAELEAKVKALEEANDTAGAEQYRTLLGVRLKIDSAETAAQDYRARLGAAAGKLAAIKLELDQLPEKMAAEAAEDAQLKGDSVTELESRAKQRKAERDTANTRRAALEAEGARRKKRLDEIPTQISTKSAELKELEGGVGPDRSSEVEKLTRLGKLQLLEKSLVSLRAEQAFYLDQAAGELLTAPPSPTPTLTVRSS